MRICRNIKVNRKGSKLLVMQTGKEIMRYGIVKMNIRICTDVLTYFRTEKNHYCRTVVLICLNTDTVKQTSIETIHYGFYDAMQQTVKSMINHWFTAIKHYLFT